MTQINNHVDKLGEVLYLWRIRTLTVAYGCRVSAWRPTHNDVDLWYLLVRQLQNVALLANVSSVTIAKVVLVEMFKPGIGVVGDGLDADADAAQIGCAP